MKKILFSDMDGTVIDGDQLINQDDKLLLDKFSQMGNLVVFNTGRNFQEAQNAIKQFNFYYDYLILNNGAQIVDQSGNELFKKVIACDIGIEIIDHCLQFANLWIYFYDGKKTLAYFQGNTYKYDDHGKLMITNDDDFKKTYSKIKEFDIIALHQDDQQIDDLLKIQAFLKENYRYDVQGTLNNFYLDITPGNCSKGTGIKKLLDLLAEKMISYAIGDSYNDISMFEYVDYGCTFNHVNNEIAKYANVQVTNVAKLITKILEGGNKDELAR